MSKAPKLRFKEFSGDWESKKLEEISTKIGDGIHATPEYVDVSEIKFINGNNIKNYKIVTNENTKSISEEELKKYNIQLDDSSILMSINGTIGNIGYYNNEKVLLGKSVAYININSNTSNKFFLGTLLQTNKIQQKFISELTGTTIKNLSLKSIRECRLYLPLKEEQEKIASFFSLIDDKISLQGEKVEALEDYKRGMMQKIFSRELRFKDDEGRDYPEWEVTNIEKVADLEKGFTPDTKNEKNWSGDIPWLSIADMKQGKYVSDVSKHISDEALGNKKLVPKGTLIMSFKLTLGRLGIINREMMTNEAICHFYWRNKSINTEYMYYYLSTINIESFGCRAAKGITLNNDSLNSIVVKLPVIDEQNKIADILIKIDSKIEKEQEKLDALNEYKKGLLQQMFV